MNHCAFKFNVSDSSKTGGRNKNERISENEREMSAFVLEMKGP